MLRRIHGSALTYILGKKIYRPKQMTVNKKPSKQKYVKYHNDGSPWARGTMVNGWPEGYWEWFRKEGTRMRSGYFKNGKQAGEWTTYDRRVRFTM